eukprot:886925-Rhodomonas_salina.1
MGPDCSGWAPHRSRRRSAQTFVLDAGSRTLDGFGTLTFTRAKAGGLVHAAFNTATILTDDVIKVAALPPPADRRALLPSLSRPLVLTQRGSQAVEDASALAPLHNPPNLLGIRVAREIFKCPQVMCRGRRARTGAARLSIL